MLLKSPLTYAGDKKEGRMGVWRCTLWKQFAPRRSPRYDLPPSGLRIGEGGVEEWKSGGEEEDAVPNNFPISKRIPADRTKEASVISH